MQGQHRARQRGGEQGGRAPALLEAARDVDGDQQERVIDRLKRRASQIVAHLGPYGFQTVEGGRAAVVHRVEVPEQRFPELLRRDVGHPEA